MPLCVYAIVGTGAGRRALAGAPRARLRLVKAGRVSAVVADCKAAPPVSAPALRRHDAIVKRIARHAPAVLPARFGTVVQSEDSLVALLEGWSADLVGALALVDGREQMTLRVFSGEEKERNRSGKAGRPGEAGGLGETGTAYLRRRAREEQQAEAPELEPLRDAFAPLVSAERIARHDSGPLLLTAYHLIPRGRAAAYRRLLRRHAAGLRHRAVPSGPWPPYAFVPELRR